MSLVEELKTKTVFELKAYAKKKNINLDGLSKKDEILEVILNFVPKDGEEKSPEEKKKKAPNKVAVFSSRNLHWNKVGVLEKGYNIITKEESEQWLRHKAVRIATPQEVARHYGKS